MQSAKLCKVHNYMIIACCIIGRSVSYQLMGTSFCKIVNAQNIKSEYFCTTFTRIYTNLQSQTCHFGEEVVLHCGLIAKIRNARSILAHQICTSGASQRRLICFLGHLSYGLFRPIDHHKTVCLFNASAIREARAMVWSYVFRQ